MPAPLPLAGAGMAPAPARRRAALVRSRRTTPAATVITSDTTSRATLDLMMPAASSRAATMSRARLVKIMVGSLPPSSPRPLSLGAGLRAFEHPLVAAHDDGVAAV